MLNLHKNYENLFLFYSFLAALKRNVCTMKKKNYNSKQVVRNLSFKIIYNNFIFSFNCIVNTLVEKFKKGNKLFFTPFYTYNIY